MPNTMTDESEQMKKPKNEDECSHIGIVICDTGYDTSEERRDIGLKCEDCGLEWDVHFKRGNQGADIKMRATWGKPWEDLVP